MTVESAPSMTSMLSAPTEIAATSAATITADIGPSFENFSPSLNSSIQTETSLFGNYNFSALDPHIDGPRESVQTIFSEPIEQDLLTEAPSFDIIRTAGEIVAGVEARHWNNQNPEYHIEEKPVVTSLNTYSVEENDSVKIEAQGDFESQLQADLKDAAKRYTTLISVGFEPARSAEIISQQYGSADNNLQVTPRVELAPQTSQQIGVEADRRQAQITNTSLIAAGFNPQVAKEITDQAQQSAEVLMATPKAKAMLEMIGEKVETVSEKTEKNVVSEHRSEVVEQKDIAQKIDHEVSLSRMERVKKALDPLDDGEISGEDIDLDEEETEEVRSGILPQLGLYNRPDGSLPEFERGVRKIRAKSKNEFITKAEDVDRNAPPVILGEGEDEAKDEDTERVLEEKIVEIENYHGMVTRRAKMKPKEEKVA